MRHVLFLLTIGISAAALASEPGQPLDCSDWVSLAPGLTCDEVLACESPSQGWCSEGTPLQIDNERGILKTGARFEMGDVISCPSGLTAGLKLGFERLINSQETFLGYFRFRCGTAGTIDRAEFGGGPNYNDGNTAFDEEGGCLNFTLSSYCQGQDCPYLPRASFLRICGFTTTFEILQTYNPTNSGITFRVPYMPEGFQFADYFDTYHGDLATLPDWSQAQPLQCGYPALPPSVGAYLTVDDPLPAPPPGHGRYYVTAVHRQGQVRFGRQAINGVLSGRNPATLPACAE